ncbi:hypothetical protein [Mitsuaria sp. GD03876]|uniref:hypothetical protein n=1 Tax=Mitsuaria sp. GD03876 TaxID=2975399 RepID=UPI00244AD408|nr:hypothetical protein [Mitsuaria sp. GD03876]MDH0867005.1 hypothetical protein [Mitsuaria sp. GD03876]
MTPFIPAAFFSTSTTSLLLSALIAMPVQAQSSLTGASASAAAGASTSPSAAASTASAPAAVCPDASAQLEELLAGAAQRVDAAGEVQARFEVDARGQVRDIAVDGHRAYATRVRIALPALTCQGGVPQGYRLTIRFAPGQPASAASTAVAVTASPR